MKEEKPILAPVSPKQAAKKAALGRGVVLFGCVAQP